MLIGHTQHLDPLIRLQLERGVRYLFLLGQPATVQFCLDLVNRIGGLPAILSLLTEYEHRLSPELLRATGGDKFPLHLQLVPR